MAIFSAEMRRTTGLGDLGSDFDGGTSMISLAATASSRSGDGLDQTSALHGLDGAAAPWTKRRPGPAGNR